MALICVLASDAILRAWRTEIGGFVFRDWMVQSNTFLLQVGKLRQGSEKGSKPRFLDSRPSVSP